MKSRVFFVLMICAFSLDAQDRSQSATVLAVPDVQLVTQSGDHLRFNSQLVKGRIAIVTGFFTTCTSMCPITQETLAHVASMLGPRLGKDVVIISLSVDPDHDTPERMRAWAEKFHIDPGWVLASGNKAEVQTLLQSLGLFVDLPQRHQSALMVGSESSGWVRISSWSAPEKLVKLVDTIAASRTPAGSSNSATR